MVLHFDSNCILDLSQIPVFGFSGTHQCSAKEDVAVSVGAILTLSQDFLHTSLIPAHKAFGWLFPFIYCCYRLSASPEDD